jgi:hypothetical protein
MIPKRTDIPFSRRGFCVSVSVIGGALIALFTVPGRGDGLLYFLQWYATAGCIVGVSLIARELGAGPRGQVFSALICATIPAGLLGESTAGNDYVAAFWMVCFIVTLLHVIRRGRGRRFLSFQAGTALGLALLTQEAVFPIAACFLVLFFFMSYGKSGKAPWKRTVVILVIALAVRLLSLVSTPLPGTIGFGAPYDIVLFLPHLLLAALSLLLFLTRARLRAQRDLVFYLIALSLGLLLSCLAHRIDLVLAVLVSPFIAITMREFTVYRRRNASDIISVILIAYALVLVITRL